MWALGLVLTEVITGQLIASRMGRTDTPFFMQKESFQKHLDEACRLGGPQLGQLCRRLLETEASQRATASEILSSPVQVSSFAQSMMASSTSAHLGALKTGMSVAPPMTTSVLDFGQLPTTYARVSEPLATSFSPRALNPIGEGLKSGSMSAPVNSTASDFRVGQQVIYQSKTHQGVYQASILGRDSLHNSWIVQVAGGEVKQVPDSERWRLTPSKSR
jgi:hypothetical protein